jgi:uncharacterized ParB-like nuclease family protein
MTTKTIPLDQIKTDGGTQARAALNEDVVAEYAESIKGGADLPPVVVFQDGKRYWLADGFHRFHAHRKALAESITADVRVGTKRDAILHSVGANAAHGLRRTNADKRCAVKTLLSDKEWGGWSDRQIADACGVSHPFVAALRNPERAEKQQQHREASPRPPAEPTATLVMEPSTPTSFETASATSPVLLVAAQRSHDVFGDDQAGDDELSEVDSLRQQVVELTDILTGFDITSQGDQATASEITRLTSQLRAVESQRDQYMNTCNEIKRQVKALQRENARLLALVPKEAA